MIAALIGPLLFMPPRRGPLKSRFEWGAVWFRVEEKVGGSWILTTRIFGRGTSCRHEVARNELCLVSILAPNGS